MDIKPVRILVAVHAALRGRDELEQIDDDGKDDHEDEESDNTADNVLEGG